MPVDGGEVVGVACGGGVGSDQQVRVAGERREVVPAGAAGAVVGPDPKVRGEAGGLTLPGADHRHRAEEQGRAGVVVRPVVRLEREQLHGLAKTHVVGEAGAQAERGQEGQPRDAPLLVGPEEGGERGRWVDRCQGALGAAGEEVAEPAVGVDAGQRQGQVVLVREARGEREDVRGAGAAAPAAAQELQALAQLVLVHAHPCTAQSHQGCLRGDERGDLLLVEHGVRAVAHRDRPPEVGHLLAAEAAADHHARGGGAARGEA